MDLETLSLRCSSPEPLLLWRLVRVPGGLGQVELLVAFEVGCWEREKKFRKWGFVQASDDAVIPMPGSTVDQMDTKAL